MRCSAGRDEMRKQLLTMVLPLLAILLAGSAMAQSTNTPAPKRAALLKVSVVRGEDGVNLEMSVRGQVMPSVSTLDTPARVVVDLPETVALNSQSISVGDNGVK